MNIVIFELTGYLEHCNIWIDVKSHFFGSNVIVERIAFESIVVVVAVVVAGDDLVVPNAPS